MCVCVCVRACVCVCVYREREGRGERERDIHRYTDTHRALMLVSQDSMPDTRVSKSL
jgi:hypothetical protein